MAKSFDELAARTMNKAAIRRAKERARRIICEVARRNSRRASTLLTNRAPKGKSFATNGGLTNGVRSL
jgi:hypothetical protein